MHTTPRCDTVRLAAGVAATVSPDTGTNTVTLSIADQMGMSLTVRMPSEAASDLAVVMVNAANGV